MRVPGAGCYECASTFLYLQTNPLLGVQPGQTRARRSTAELQKAGAAMAGMTYGAYAKFQATQGLPVMSEPKFYDAAGIKAATERAFERSVNDDCLQLIREQAHAAGWDGEGPVPLPGAMKTDTRWCASPCPAPPC